MTTRKIVQRAATGDRGPPEAQRVEITTAEQIGPKMRRLPNGNLLCLDVPIARVGWMVYGPGETPIEVGKHTGLAHVHRDEAALFDPKCIGSFMGAAVVDEHPDDDVTPENWKKLSHGFATTNVRRGEDEDSDVLLADLIITDKVLIDAVLAGKREVSCGYDADYEQTGDGEGKQSNIIGNHIALVEKGRCGPRCAIGDRAHQPEGTDMTTKRKLIAPAARRAVLDARRKVLDAETELFNAEQTGGMGTEGEESGETGLEAGNGDTHIHIHAGGQTGGESKAVGATDEEEIPGGEATGGGDLEGRIGALETTIGTISDTLTGLTEAVRKLAGAEAAETEETIDGEEAGTEGGENGDYGDGTQDGEGDPEAKKDDDKSGKTMDSQALATSYAQVLAQAEVLVPGFRMPTFDAKAKRKTTVDAMCSARRKALGLACATTDGATLVTSVNGGKDPDLDKMGCSDVATLFKAAAGAKALMNNRASTGDSGSMGKPNMQHQVGSRTIADINKANADYWAKVNKTA